MEIGEAGRRHRERANDANAGRTSPFFCFGFTFRLILAADSAPVAAAQRGGSMLADVSGIHFRRFSTLTCFDSLSSSRKRRASSGVIICNSKRPKPILIPRPPVLFWILMTNETLSRSIIDPLRGRVMKFIAL